MKIYKGKSGINQTYQDEFEENIPCKKCKGNARILFTAIENQNRDLNKNAIAAIHQNMKDGKYWVHDLIAVSVYLCEKCFEANAELNQA